MKKFLPFAGACLAIAIYLPAATAGPTQQELVELHAALGSLIDARENQQLHIFDLDLGLKAARIYQLSAIKWVLHLMGTSETGPWLITQEINQTTFLSLKRRLQSRLKKHAKGKIFSQPVLSIRQTLVTKGSESQRLALLDGSTIFATLTKCSPDTIIFVTTSGTQLQVQDKDIVMIDTPRKPLKDGMYGKPDPNDVRLFFAPTGRTLRKGESQLSDFYIFFPAAAVGVTDNFMLAGGVSLIPGIDQLVYAAPKLNLIHREKMDLATGILFTTIPGSGGGNFGIAYSSLSLGDVTGGVTLGAGFAFEGADTDGRLFAGFVGGEKQLSPNFKIISEGWILTANDDSELIAIGGLRFIGDQLTVDFGLATSSSLLDGHNDIINFIPWLSFSVNFGR